MRYEESLRRQCRDLPTQSGHLHMGQRIGNMTRTIWRCIASLAVAAPSKDRRLDNVDAPTARFSRDSPFAIAVLSRDNFRVK
jgi:hypothetical protein